VAVAVAATQAEAAIQDLVMTKRDRGGFITRYIYYASLLMFMGSRLAEEQLLL